tara:strand:- start:348 stop:584 length:237 start_codon:yes stop_codon:yes gene_type:complete
MPIEHSAGGTMITGDSIMHYRLLNLIVGLKVEIQGMRLTSRGSTCYSILKREYGLKGNKEKVLAQAQEIMDKIKEEYI